MSERVCLSALLSFVSILRLWMGCVMEWDGKNTMYRCAAAVAAAAAYGIKRDLCNWWITLCFSSEGQSRWRKVDKSQKVLILLHICLPVRFQPFRRRCCARIMPDLKRLEVDMILHSSFFFLFSSVQANVRRALTFCWGTCTVFNGIATVQPIARMCF